MSSPSQPPNSSPGIFFSVEGDSEALAEKVENQEYRTRLHTILADEAQSTSETLQSTLRLGAEWLNVENGHLARIDPAKGTHTITEVSGSHPVISRGSTADLSTTYCRRVIVQNDALAVENAPEQGWKGDPAFEEFDLSTYLGAKVVVEGDLYGTICFVDREPRVDPITESDAAALALIVRTVDKALERRQHEDRLRQTPAQLEALFEASPNMIAIQDLKGNLITPNPRLCNETGYEADRVIGMVEDTDEQKRPEEELRAAKEEAERLNRMKGVFLANMSHEIRTPLTSIIGFAEAIGEEVETLEDEISSSSLDRFAELIEENGHRLLKTLDAVLNLSRLEAGETELSLEPVNLTHEVTGATELFEARALENGIGLLVETPSTPIWVQADEGLLQIVLQNLIPNALKYTEKGGTVWIRARTDDGDALLEVEDTGIGMDPDRVPELFEPFRQASEGPSREYEGTGLGLAVTKEAVARMEGSIDVDTAEGEGSRFTVRFPQADSAP